MLAIIAALTLGLGGPPDLLLPTQQAIALDDEAIGAYPYLDHWEARGHVVADDGSAIFAADGSVMRMYANLPYCFREKLYLRSAGEPAFTTGQKEGVKGTFAPVEVQNVVSAIDREHLVVRYLWPDASGRERYAVSSLSLKDGERAKGQVLSRARGKEEPGRAIADLSSSAILVPYFQQVGPKAEYSEFELLNGKTKARFKYRFGYVPFAFDSAQDLVLGYIFGEHGGQNQLMIHRISTNKDELIERRNGRIGISALLPGGRILTTFTRSSGDEDSQEQFGLFESVPPYKSPKYLGPYRLVGSSRNGQWLVISQLEKRKSWLVKVG